MKVLVLFFVLASLNVFAQGGGDRVGSGGLIITYFDLIQSSDLGDRERNSTRVSIYSNSMVGRVKQKLGRNGETISRHEYVGEISHKQMLEVEKCSDILRKKKLQRGVGFCAGGASTRYEHHLSGNVFAEAQCGDLNTVPHACAKKMVKLLNSFLTAPGIN